MTSNEAESKTAGEKKRLFQADNQKSLEEKSSALPKWFEDSQHIHEHQTKYLDKIYEMREKLIQDEKHLPGSSSTRLDRQKFLSTRPLQGRPRAFTSPSLLDDVRGILISRRPDVRSNQTAVSEGEEYSKHLPGGSRNRMITREGGVFYRSAPVTSEYGSGVKNDEVFIKLTRCTHGRPSEACQFCRRNSQPNEIIVQGKRGKRGFCTQNSDDKNRNTTKRRESRKDSSSSSRDTAGSQTGRTKNKKDTFSKLPKLKEIPRYKKYEAKSNSVKSSGRKGSSSPGQKSGKPTTGKLDTSEELFAKLELLDAQLSKGNSPTSISPRSISPFSMSDTSNNSPTSPSHHFKFPDTESSPPEVSISLPPVPLTESNMTASDFSLSARAYCGLSGSLDSGDAPVIVLRPATPYIERSEQPTQSQKKGWCLWKAVRQTEVRRVELRKLIDDIKEFNTNNKTIEKRLREVSST